MSWTQHNSMTTTRTENVSEPETSHVESQGPFHRVFIERSGFLCLPPALFDNTASEARDHFGLNPLASLLNPSKRTNIPKLATTFYGPCSSRCRYIPTFLLCY